MKKKYLLMVPAFAAALLGGSAALAHGGGFGFGMMSGDPATVAVRFDESIARQAGVLGITAQEMKAYWAEGKNLQDIAKERGITEQNLQAKMKAAHQEEMKQFLGTLVSQGKLTQAQADARLKFMETKMESVGKMKKGKHGGAMMR